MAAGFVGSAEYQAAYGAHPSAVDLVTHYYQNILHRAPEQAGLDYWVDVLTRHPDAVADVLADISESAENVAGTAALIGNGISYLPFPG